ncbi:MAG: DUF1592 domain-containing protein [Verrucomicrobiales bacterium]
MSLPASAPTRVSHSRFPLLPITFLVSTALFGGLVFWIIRAEAKPPRIDYATEIEPLLSNYCFDCHGDGAKKGKIELDAHATPEERNQDLGLWDLVYKNLEVTTMPPAGKPQPSPAEREKLLRWIESSVFHLDPENPDPGRVTLRRLNRDEYNRTIRDLFGIEGLRPADRFPSDDTGYGFDTIGEVLRISPGLLEKYVDASERVLDRIIITDPPQPVATDVPESEFRARRGSGKSGSGSLASNGTISARFQAGEAGAYQIEVMASGSPAGGEWPLMEVEFDGGGPKAGVRVEGGPDSTKGYQWKLDLKKGETRSVAISFNNDFYDPNAADPGQRDRNLYVRGLKVLGPMDAPVPPPTAAHLKLLSLAGTAQGDDARLRAILEAFLPRVYRRPLRKGELDRHLALAAQVRQAGGDFERSLKGTLQAALVSPHFLYRSESQPEPGNPQRIHRLDAHALASRLSYFLWSSLPDDELFRLADSGRLTQELDGQIARMLRDPKAEALTTNFAGQWLQLRNLDQASPDRNTYPSWDDSLRLAMKGETERFFDDIVRQDRSILEFLDSDHTFVNERLARHYGIPGIQGEQFQRIVLTGPLRQQRGGLISQASILTLTSNPTRTSAVNRGNWVLENFLAAPPPPPPANIEIPPLEASGKGENHTKTLRQQLEMHRAKPLCASCHDRMDPIGFGLENFDGIGTWRDEEQGQKINAAGELYTGEKFSGPAELRNLLTGSKRDAFVRSLTEALLTYSLGRGLEYYDKPAVNGIATATEAGGYRFHSLVKAVVHSVPFQYRRGDAPPRDQAP